MPIAGVRRVTRVRRRGGAQARRALAAGTRHATCACTPEWLHKRIAPSSPELAALTARVPVG
eukprot:2777233-Alexandrium_andersonii.AAC.1